MVHSWVQRTVRKETTLAALVPMPLPDQMKRSCEQRELGHHTTPVSQGLIMVVEEKILQCVMWNVAAVVAAAAAAADVNVDGDAPSLVGLVVQYVLGLSPVSMKFRHYSTTVLVANQLILHFLFDVINVILRNGKKMKNISFSLIFASCHKHKFLSLVLPSIFNYTVSNAVSYKIREPGCMGMNDQ